MGGGGEESREKVGVSLSRDLWEGKHLREIRGGRATLAMMGRKVKAEGGEEIVKESLRGTKSPEILSIGVQVLKKLAA